MKLLPLMLWQWDHNKSYIFTGAKPANLLSVVPVQTINGSIPLANPTTVPPVSMIQNCPPADTASYHDYQPQTNVQTN